jgi:uncharacterized protein (DUF2384 family)
MITTSERSYESSTVGLGPHEHARVVWLAPKKAQQRRKENKKYLPERESMMTSPFQRIVNFDLSFWQG